MTVERDVKPSLLMRTDKSMCKEQRAANDGDRGFQLEVRVAIRVCMCRQMIQKYKEMTQLKADILG